MMLDLVKAKVKSLIGKTSAGESYLLKKQYQTEVALINGTHQNANRQPSILHFSFNKAGTQYIKSLLERCARESTMVPVSIHDYAFHSDHPFLDQLSAEEMKQHEHLFKDKGYLYSVFGGMIEGIPTISNYKVVLVTRDPRDILVSEYFSIGRSHAVPSKTGNKHEEFMSKRLEVQEISVDEHVLAESDRVKEIFLRYERLLLDQHADAHVTKYEDMVSDFEAWLDALLTYCGLDLSDAFIKQLIEVNEAAKPKGENINKHMRKGKAGDYKEKLKPETIAILNEKFAPVLERYQYQGY